MKRRAIGLVAALVLALVGVGLVITNLNKDSEPLSEEAVVSTRSVVVVRSPIPAGTEIGEIAETYPLSLAEEQRPVDSVPVDTVATIPELLAFRDQMTASEFLADELVRAGRFVPSESYSIAAAPIEVPEGLLQATFSLGTDRVLGGNIRAGDNVAVIASFEVAEAGAVTHVILHKALVTNVAVDVDVTQEGVSETASSNALDPALTPAGRWMITVGLEPVEMERLVYALEYGRIWLASEPDEAPEDDVEIQTVDTVLGEEAYQELLERARRLNDEAADAAAEDN